jgi:hypothetical protein
VGASEGNGTVVWEQRVEVGMVFNEVPVFIYARVCVCVCLLNS